MPNEITVLYKNINKVCKQQGTNVHQLSLDLGFPPNTISSWKEMRIWMKYLPMVAAKLNVSIDSLIGFIPPLEQTENNKYIREIISCLSDLKLNRKTTESIIEISRVLSCKFGDQD